MDVFYNPDVLPENEIKGTFVGRQWLVDDFTSLLSRQPKGAGMQHVLLVGARGIGKTTVLLMLRFAIREGQLARHWQAVKFPEESYGIDSLADFWMAVLEHLAADTGDSKLFERAERLKSEFPREDDLREAALALIKDWRKKHKKRLVLLVDNLDMILDQINDERENARLRDVLMNDGTVMLIGTSTKFFDQARAYNEPLYNFFKVYNLENLKFEEMQELLRRRASVDGVSNFEATLKENASRIRVLEYFTGGNPRLVLMLYRIVTASGVAEVRSGLEKLLDEVTPYYKAKMEALPPQQRKILDHIARVSAQTHEGVTPTEIGQAIRMASNQVSSQLRRLLEQGFVRTADLRGRTTVYTLSERLYAIWYQMRFGHDARERMKWLVRFLRGWYDAEQTVAETGRLTSLYLETMRVGDSRKAQEIMEYLGYLTEAAGGIDEPLRFMEAFGLRDWARASKILDDAIQRSLVNAESASPWEIRGAIQSQMGRFEDALAAFDRSLAIEPNNAQVWTRRGQALVDLGRLDDAMESLDRAVSIQPNLREAWRKRALAAVKLRRDADAIASWDRALAIREDDDESWFLRGVTLERLGRQEEAHASYERVLAATVRIPLEYPVRFWAGVRCGRLELEEARNDWNTFLRSAPEGKHPIEPLELLVALTSPKTIAFVRELITDSGLEERLFPLARAIDYVSTKDPALLEKLSPEYRPIVEEIVTKIQR